VRPTSSASTPTLATAVRGKDDQRTVSGWKPQVTGGGRIDVAPHRGHRRAVRCVAAASAPAGLTYTTAGVSVPLRNDRELAMSAPSLPSLEGVRHRFVDLGQGVTIHVAEAGPADGAPVMLVHGFPQRWWQWREIMGHLAADGYRVLCPDLRGAGWSTAPAGSYRKIDMADDLVQLLQRLKVGPVAVAAHDWGGPVAFIMMLRHPEQVAGFFGINIAAPWLRADGALLKHLWRFWYQIPIALPVVGPKVIADRDARFIRRVCSWAGAGFTPDDLDVYLRPMRQRSHAVAGSGWYRTFLAREAIAWMRGELPIRG